MFTEFLHKFQWNSSFIDEQMMAKARKKENRNRFLTWAEQIKSTLSWSSEYFFSFCSNDENKQQKDGVKIIAESAMEMGR